MQDQKQPKRKGRPPLAEIDEQKLKAICRLKPTLEDVAAFFETTPVAVEYWCKKNHNMTFAHFREQNLVQTRFMLIRTAIEKAQKGDNAMIIFCLKNLCGWKDRYESEVHPSVQKFILKYSMDDEKESSKAS